MNKYFLYTLTLMLAIMLTGCDYDSTPNIATDKFIAKYPDMENLGADAKAILAGEYLGTAHMNMDRNGTPAPYYDKTFIIEKIGNSDKINLRADITPGNMPFPVQYRLTADKFTYSKTGYHIDGKFNVNVPYDSSSQASIKIEINDRLTVIANELSNLDPQTDATQIAKLNAEKLELQTRLNNLEQYSSTNITTDKEKELQDIIDAQKFKLGDQSRIIKTFDNRYKLILYYPKGRIFFEGYLQK